MSRKHARHHRPSKNVQMTGSAYVPKVPETAEDALAKARADAKREKRRLRNLERTGETTMQGTDG